MSNEIHSHIAASISELKKNPMATVGSAEGAPIAILNRNIPAFYCVPADVYERMLEFIDDKALKELVVKRKNEPLVDVDLDI